MGILYAQQKNVPLYTFAESVCASGGYWLLVVGNKGKVYANQSSIVGSVGVVSQAAATKRLFDHYHLDRIQISTGEELAEAKLDPFSRETIGEDQTKYIMDKMATIKEIFETHVKDNRGDSLKDEDLPRIFNAEVVLGGEAKELGLIDELGNCNTIMERDYPEIKMKNFSETSKWDNLAAAFSGALIQGYSA